MVRIVLAVAAVALVNLSCGLPRPVERVLKPDGTLLLRTRVVTIETRRTVGDADELEKLLSGEPSRLTNRIYAEK